MSRVLFHTMDTELITDRQTMRYSCPICQRCIEDGPEGITIVHHGDATVAHRGGALTVSNDDFEQDPPTRPVLH